MFCYGSIRQSAAIPGLTVTASLQGAPELIVEIAAKSASYARRGVQEYLVFQMHERQVSWFTLRDGNYEMLTADSIFRSRVFPGLWLHAAAFWADNMATVLVVLQQGLTSPEHQAFLEELSKR
ncbi:MAG: Uma2 family endonuclease [Caldilineaceae bacterium]